MNEIPSSLFLFPSSQGGIYRAFLQHKAKCRVTNGAFPSLQIIFRVILGDLRVFLSLHESCLGSEVTGKDARRKGKRKNGKVKDSVG